MTTYPLRPVGTTIPDHRTPGATGRPPVYLPALQAIKDAGVAGTWYELAVFESATGARDSLRKIQAGTTRIPSGEWEFAKRVVDGQRSVLYVKLNNADTRFADG